MAQRLEAIAAEESANLLGGIDSMQKYQLLRSLVVVDVVGRFAAPEPESLAKFAVYSTQVFLALS